RPALRSTGEAERFDFCARHPARAQAGARHAAAGPGRVATPRAGAAGGTAPRGDQGARACAATGQGQRAETGGYSEAGGQSQIALRCRGRGLGAACNAGCRARSDGARTGRDRNESAAGAGVQILTDTQGVDFDSYLRRVVEIVRRNWYAVMPETVYLGTQGKVVVVFNINANGTVPGLRPVSLSGTASLDEAAEASIKASNPFPPLPAQFHGPFITLQFSFYYNLEPPN